MAKRDVQIEISANDRTGPGLKSAESALKRFQTAQQATQARRASFAGAEKDARDLYKAYQDAGNAAQTLGRKMGDAKRPSTQLKTEFAAAREEVRRAKAEFNEAGVAFGRMNGRIASGSGSFAQFERTADAMQTQTAATAVLARDLPKVAAAQQRVNAEAQDGATLASRLTSALAAEETAIRDLIGAENQLAAAKARGGANDIEIIKLSGRVADARRLQAKASREAAAAEGAVQAAGGSRRGGGGGLASKELDALTSAKGRGILGLRPYEVQNLSYQINDLFTQIASGTPSLPGAKPW